MSIFQKMEAGLGRKCDFIINPIAGYDFIVFNELTESDSQYLLPFTSPETGEGKEGKLAYAKSNWKCLLRNFIV